MTPLKIHAHKLVGGEPMPPSDAAKAVETELTGLAPMSATYNSNIDEGNAILIDALFKKLDEASQTTKDAVPAIVFKDDRFNKVTNSWDLKAPGVRTALNTEDNEYLTIQYAP